MTRTKKSLSKSNKTAHRDAKEDQPVLYRRRLVGVMFGRYSICGRYEEVWSTPGSLGLHTVMTYGKTVNFTDNPEITSTARAANILMEDLLHAIRRADKDSKAEL